jgi:hypothetical protein
MKKLAMALQTLPPIVLLAVVCIIIGAGVVLAHTTINRHISATRQADMTTDVLSGSETMTMYGTGDEASSVVYRVTNTGASPYTVTVTPTYAGFTTPSIAPNNFTLAAGAYTDVSVTVTLPAGTDTGTCDLEFKHN